MKWHLRPLPIFMAALVAAGCAAGAGAGDPGRQAPEPPGYQRILGTWTGVAYAEGDSEGVGLTVILIEREGRLAGSVSVPDQMMDRTPLQGITWSGGVLTCYVNMQGMPVDIRLILEEDTFRGSFYSDMISGVMTLRKQ